MDKQTALDILFLCIHGYSHRALSELFNGPEKQGQGFGEDLVEEACAVIGTSKELIYEAQADLLHKKEEFWREQECQVKTRLSDILGWEENLSFREVLDRVIFGREKNEQKEETGS